MGIFRVIYVKNYIGLHYNQIKNQTQNLAKLAQTHILIAPTKGGIMLAKILKSTPHKVPNYTVAHYITSNLPVKLAPSWMSGLILSLSLLLLSACAVPGSTQPVLKLGLLAPFEGELRHQGYQRLYGVKLALQEANLSGGVAGYKIELVALNDYNDPLEATAQAKEIMLDPAIQAVIGPWDADVYQAAAQVLRPNHLLHLQPTHFTATQTLPATFAADYTALAGTPPTTQAEQAYLATQHFLTTLAQLDEPSRLTFWQTQRPAP
jgi:hypothetical protein